MKLFRNKFHTWEFRTCYIVDPAEALKVLEKLNPEKLHGIDIETAKNEKFLEHPEAGLCPHLSQIRLIQVYDDAAKISYVFDCFHIDKKIFEPYLLAGKFVAHYGIFEIKHFTLAGFANMNIGCSMLLSQLIVAAEHVQYELEDEDDDDEDKTGLSKYKKFGHGLDALTQRLFGVKVEKSQQTSDWNKATLDKDQIVYAGLDAVLTYKCAVELAPRLKFHKMERCYQLLKEMQHVVARMELNGLPVDWTYHAGLISEWEKNTESALVKTKPFFGETNMSSGKQMNAWLKNYLKDDPITLANWPKTNKCTCEKIGGKLVRPCECFAPYGFGKTQITAFTHLEPIAALLDYKKWKKLTSTYGQSLIDKKHPITKRLHTSYTLGQTVTGRLSSRKPNIQNFPREKIFRNMFAAPKGYVLVVSDFSQIELRLQAEFSQDPVMLEIYKKGQDVYKTMASFLFGVPIDKISKDQRFVGKTVMLALGYGMGATKLELYAMNAGVKKHPTAFWQEAHKTYHQRFNVYSRWCNKIRDRAKQLGYIDTLLGKRRKLEEKEIFTCGPNTVIQGTAAELIERASIICQRRIDVEIPKKACLSGSVHDEAVVMALIKFADTAKNILAESMKNAMKEMFPKAISFDVADAAVAVRWGEAKAEL